MNRKKTQKKSRNMHIGLKVVQNVRQINGTKRVFAGIGDVEKAVGILVFLVNGAHESGCRWKHVIDKDKDRLFGSETDALANDIDKLAHRQV